jgi:hypothetical protein
MIRARCALAFATRPEQDGFSRVPTSGNEPERTDTMKRTLFTVAAALTLGAGAAFADCAQELEALEGVSKDGTMAPLAESGATPQTGGGTAAGGGEPTDAGKAGNLVPMGESPDVATSAEDAAAQSQGGETAAAQAMGASGGDEGGRQAAIDEARAALAAGDEDACMAALEKAKGM